MATKKKSEDSPLAVGTVVYIDDHKKRLCDDTGIDEPINKYRIVRDTANHTDYELLSGDTVTTKRVSKSGSIYYNRPVVFRTLAAAWEARLKHLRESIESAKSAAESHARDAAKQRSRAKRLAVRLKRATNIANAAIKANQP